MKILVVDDNVESADILSLALGTLGHDAHTVYSGTAALAALDRESFDLMIIDLLMPDPDGLAVAKLVHNRFPDFPMLGISGIPSKEDEAQGQHLFYEGVIHKPFLVDDIKDVLDRVAGHG